ncbi:hypothetical protein ARMSODRAFT_1027237 [Armillaria solidipes]|uniref:Uncharacterized protein n=1 Tax=Armillaria solidipes TaxID=1076256 RepID=A0A2H3AS84_9AGAR|nr:hypothetical protein ARMSODRAFT_1027237 [Armillaria solidipes]
MSSENFPAVCGSDSSEITGSFGYTPITTTYPAGIYWGIDESITHVTSTAILSSTAGIVNTGKSF